MAKEDSTIRLGDEELRLLKEWSGRVGKPVEELLGQVIRDSATKLEGSSESGRPNSSFFEKLERKGLVGCLAGGPTDLSSNPKHMEGFGE